jgi:cytochrome c oxidase cbb3-type subunit III
MDKSKWLWLAAILFVALSSFAHTVRAQDSQDSEDHPDRKTVVKPTGQGPDAARGQKTFQQNCGVCHGNDATGGRGPDLLRSPVLAHDVNGDLIGEAVHKGRPDKGMPPMSLTESEIADVAAFLHARVKEALQSMRVPKVYDLQRLLIGNADAGKAYFEGPGGCTNCHSVSGDLAGVAKKYTPIDLQARILYPEKLFKNTKTDGIVTLPSGEQVHGHVLYQDDFAVGLIDSSGWYRSFDRAKNKVEFNNRLAAHRDQLFKLSQQQVHDLFAYIQTLK